MFRSYILPSDFCAIPVTSQSDAVAQVCVIVRQQPDPVAGHLVILRETVDVRALLAALVDRSGCIRQWLELWVQQAGMDHQFDEDDPLTNGDREQRWEGLVGRDLDAAYVTEWEHGQATSIYIDVAAQETITPETFDGNRWVLCSDDAVLRRNGLAGFQTSWERYLVAADGPDGGRLVGLQGGHSDVPDLKDTWPGFQGLVALNAQAGHMSLRPYLPLDIEEFSDVLAGHEWQGTWSGLDRLDTDGYGAALSGDDMQTNPQPVHFMARWGSAATTIEVLYLKLQLWHDAIRAVQEHTRDRDAPMLNLDGDSFRVSFAGDPGSLPALWNAQLSLVRPGCAVRYQRQGARTDLFQAAGEVRPSPFRPQLATGASAGRGQVMIDQVIGEGRDGMILEGYLDAHGHFSGKDGDLVEICLIGHDTSVDLVGYIRKEAGFRGSQVGFRTFPSDYGPRNAEWLGQTAGSRFPKCEYRIHSRIGSAVDLYGLAVLGLRLLCVDESQNLAHAVSGLEQFLQELREHYDRNQSLEEQVRKVYASGRWSEVLGPQRVVHPGPAPGQAMAAVTEELWGGVLRLLAIMTPGENRGAICDDFSGGLHGSLHGVYDEVLDECRALAERARSLVLVDWSLNAEVAQVIDEVAGCAT